MNDSAHMRAALTKIFEEAMAGYNSSWDSRFKRIADTAKAALEVKEGAL